jgi:cell division protein FtsX
MATQQKILQKLLLRKGNQSRLWMAWTTLCIGTTLLLFTVLIWWNFQELLYGKNDSDSLGSSFITVSKKVTSENMGRPQLTTFSQADIEEIRKTAGVQDIGVLTSNKFPAYIQLSGTLNFSTDIFLEAVPDRFIDKKPDNWFWDSSIRQLPIILSGEFLNLYNYGFATSQGLPQLSEATIQTLAFDLVVGNPDRRETYSAHVGGFSDRIASVLVPQSFINYANSKYGSSLSTAPSRLIIKIADPSDKSFVDFMEKHNYVTNAENLRWSKLRSVVEVVVAATGVLALLLMGISMLVFTLFIELTIAQAQQSLELLTQIGYAPSFLRKFMTRRFVPLTLGAVLLALFLALIAQYTISLIVAREQLNLPVIPGIHIWITATLCLLLLYWQIRTGIAKALK